ncbi:unnamed protein product, partial [marine sediment metagenome]
PCILTAFNPLLKKLKTLLFGLRMAKMTGNRIKQAGLQCTINKLNICPNNGETLDVHFVAK